MAIDIKHMLKVYNYVNDEKKPKFNLKFLAVFVALVLAIGALVAFSLHATPSSGGADSFATKSDYAGLSDAEVAAGLPSSVAEARLAGWKAEHPDVELVRAEPVYKDGRLIGYNVMYRE